MMQNTRNRKIGIDMLFIFGLFILIYNPPLFMMNTMHTVGLFSLAYLVIVRGGSNLFVLKTNTLRLVLGFAILFLYLFICVYVINGQALDSTLFPIYFIIDIIPFGMAMKKYIERHQLEFEWAISIVINAAIIQSIFAAITLLFPNVQSFFVERMIAYGYNEIYSTLSVYRMYGFSNALTNATPVVQSIIAVISVWLALNWNKKYYIAAFFIMFSAIINARISIVVFAIGVIVLLIKRSTNSSGRIKIIFATVVSYIVVVFLLLPLIQNISPLTYEWVTDGFNELSSFKLGSNSYANNSYFGYLINQERFVFPEGLSGFLFGKGYSIMSSRNPSGFQSDVGYICDIWTGGVVYIGILYSFFLSLLIKLRKNTNALMAFIASYYMIALLFINIKGVALSMNAFINLLIVIVCISMADYQGGDF